MRPAHVTRDGRRLICSVPGCGEELARLIRHPELEAVVAELLPWYVLDRETGIWRPTRSYRERGVPFKRRPATYGPAAHREPEIGFDVREDLTLAHGLDLPLRSQRQQPLPATVRCRNGHLSVIDPDRIQAIEAWYDHTGAVQRKG